MTGKHPARLHLTDWERPATRLSTSVSGIWVRQNSDPSHHCMHSSPYYGEIKPKQTVSRRGVILFGDTTQDVVKQFKREKISPYLGPPEGQ